MALVVRKILRKRAGNPNRCTVRVSFSPSRTLEAAPGCFSSRSRARASSSDLAFVASAWSQATLSFSLTHPRSRSGRWYVTPLMDKAALDQRMLPEDIPDRLADRLAAAAIHHK